MMHMLQIRIVDTHSNYLGLPLIFGNKKVSLFRSIEEKMLKKTWDWKHKLLSGAGREVMIKSVLQVIPLYTMSCFKLPVSICKKLTSVILKFWWHITINKGIH
ncbi:hypothetical protein QQ045_025974 [Rhodiola kirilowii]